MKAAVFYRPNAPLKVENVDVPKITPREVLVKIANCGICGGDVQRMAGKIPVKAPQILGHEPAGIVEAVGSEVELFRRGDRVVLSAVGCGECFYCKMGLDNVCLHIAAGFGVGRDGAFAEFCKVPARQLFKLPEGVPLEAGSVITASSGTVFHAIRVSAVSSGDTAIIFGAGCLGTQALQFLKVMGVRVVVVDVVEEKMDVAKRLGADLVLNAKESDPVKRVREITEGRGADVAFEIAGRPESLIQALDCCRPGGTIVDVGSIMEPVPIRMMPFIDGGLSLSREMTLKTISHYSRKDMVALLKLISHTPIDFTTGACKVTLDEVNEGFNKKRSGKFARVLVCPE